MKSLQLLLLFLLFDYVVCLNRTQCPNSAGDILSRKKRWLAFPPKSNLVITIVLLKPTIWARGMNTLHEMDVFFPVPRNIFRLEFDRRKPKMDRTVLYSQIESVFDLFGHDGHACVLKALCDFNYHRQTSLTILMDLMKLIFKIPEGPGESVYDVEFEPDCRYPCQVSFIEEIKAIETSILMHNYDNM